jgi:hypothetical protein
MAEERKSPQRKKEFEYSKDHFSFSRSPQSFAKQWKRKKTLVNREYRRKSGELLAQAKPEMPANDVELIAGDITVAQLAKSVLRERLHKNGTVSVGEKVKLKLEKRAEMVGRRVQHHGKYDREAAQTVATLSSLEGAKLVDFVRRSAVFLDGGNPLEWDRVKSSKEPIDRALSFLEGLNLGNARLHDALRRNQELCEALQSWVENANRILRKDQRVVQRKIEQKQTTTKKVNALRKRASQS